ncbi:ferritin [Salinispira pacifica]|uniref:Ferritin n=1 Tax=Salinispira pacifica TaxID=1307761 RepID=V5WK55_9SPIO|nr:ferritin [Salinispira pacifica]AHC15561.1 Ferritin [Salinispira pacifica]
MKIPAKVEAAINTQIKEEFDSAYLYLAMAAWFEDQDLPGFAVWMRSQYQEELEHAHKFFDYLFEREGRSLVPSIKEPQKEWKSPLDAFRAAYDHEQYITSCIHKLVKTAREADDVASERFLDWYVNEQVEEESTAMNIIKQLERIEGSKYGLFMLDKEMSSRGTLDE